MLHFSEYYNKPSLILLSLLNKTCRLWPDRLFLRFKFYLTIGKRLDLNNPQTFSEKLQWLKLNNRKPIYTTMVDKYEAKKYVAGIIGEEHIINTIAVYERAEDINFDALPNQFVLKCTHDSGGIVICRDKSKLDRREAVKKLRRGLKQNFYWRTREWPYKNVKPRIIAEEYIEPSPNVSDLPDYKWYCFNGEPQFCQVIQNRTTKETIDFFDTEWNHQEFVGLNPTAGPAAGTAAVVPKRPFNLDTQIKIARELSNKMSFSRIDLYEAGGNTFFGEITLFPLSGFGSFYPDKYNTILGQMITLPGEKRACN